MAIDERKGAVCPLAAVRLTPEDIFEQMKAEVVAC
jgi:hypothetical protein